MAKVGRRLVKLAAKSQFYEIYFTRFPSQSVAAAAATLQLSSF